MLTCFQSNAPAKRKLCSGKSKAMLGQNKSYAQARQKLCSGKSKAMLGQNKSYAQARQKQFTIFEDVGTRRAALLGGESLFQ